MSDDGPVIRDFISKEIMLEEGPSSVTESTRLVGGVLDSLGLMQLVSFIQEEFGVTFEETDVTPENFQTVETVERLLARKGAGRVDEAMVNRPSAGASPGG